jgi:hypothetical protein
MKASAAVRLALPLLLLPSMQSYGMPQARLRCFRHPVLLRSRAEVRVDLID